MRQPTFKLPSPETGSEYWLFVEDPGAPGPWPVVLFMDGDFQAKAGTADAYRALRKAGAIPPLLIIGVGYGAPFGKPENKRGRDYTPVAHPDEPSSGDADAFLKFLTGTLWTELQRRYPVDDARRGIAGHSLGSLLALHALFQPQPFFTHFLASAPSIWWADRDILQRAARLRARQATLPARLFLSIGEKDSESGLGDLALLEKQLAAQPFAQLEITSMRFPGKTHYDVTRDAYEAGLRALFGNTTRG